MNLFLAIVLVAATWWATVRLIQWLVARDGEELPIGKQAPNKAKVLQHLPAETRR